MDSAEPTNELIKLAVAGDGAVTAQLLAHHSAHLARRLERRLKLNPFADFSAEDVLQETFIDVFRGIGSFDIDRGVPFVAWLNRVADNRLANFLRSRSRVKRGGKACRVRTTDSSLVRLLNDVGDDQAGTGSQRLAGDEAKHAIDLCIAALPDAQQEAVDRFYLRDESLEEVAEAMNSTKDAVRGLIYRARETMHGMMGTSSKWFGKK